MSNTAKMQGQEKQGWIDNCKQVRDKLNATRTTLEKILGTNRKDVDVGVPETALSCPSEDLDSKLDTLNQLANLILQLANTLENRF